MPYAAAIALVSIHAAIAFNDVLLLKLGARRLNKDGHMASVHETQRQCKAKGIDGQGVKHLKMLVAEKSKVSYGDKAITPEVLNTLSIASQRFETWFYKQIQEIT